MYIESVHSIGDIGMTMRSKVRLHELLEDFINELHCKNNCSKCDYGCLMVVGGYGCPARITYEMVERYDKNNHSIE